MTAMAKTSVVKVPLRVAEMLDEVEIVTWAGGRAR